MWRWERWRTQKKVADTASATRMKSMQRTESSRNWPDSTLVSFTTGIWVRLPLWRTHINREREHTVRAVKDATLSSFWLMWPLLIYSNLHIKSAVHQFSPEGLSWLSREKMWTQQHHVCFLTNPHFPLPAFSFHHHCLTRPHSLVSSNTGLIICIQTQSTLITSPCPVLSPHCAPL